VNVPPLPPRTHLIKEGGAGPGPCSALHVGGLREEVAQLWGPAIIDLATTHDGQRKDVFRLSPEEVRGLLQQHRLSEEDLLLALIAPASSFARPLISSFHVG
jgi:hypothetical protein